MQIYERSPAAYFIQLVWIGEMNIVGTAVNCLVFICKNPQTPSYLYSRAWYKFSQSKDSFAVSSAQPWKSQKIIKDSVYLHPRY